MAIMIKFGDLKKGQTFVKVFSSGQYLTFEKITKTKAKCIGNQGFGDKRGIGNIIACSQYQLFNLY